MGVVVMHFPVEERGGKILQLFSSALSPSMQRGFLLPSITVPRSKPRSVIWLQERDSLQSHVLSGVCSFLRASDRSGGERRGHGEHFTAQLRHDL